MHKNTKPETTETQTTYTNKKTVSCAGNGALGHPKVYLNMGKDNKVVCPYCSHTFIYNPQNQAC